MNILIWIGIFLCITQSAMFSGLNLALFSVSRLLLEVESSKNNQHAKKILELRKDSNFLLTTILWGNVGINVLLTLLSDSILSGVFAFLFSTVIITLIGEIVPQAYFSRHAIKSGAVLLPVLRFYQILLFPFAKLTALILDKWLGPEGIQYFKERELKELVKMHTSAVEASEIGSVEGIGCINFLSLDDLPIAQMGNIIEPSSIITLPFRGNLPLFPEIKSSSEDLFLKSLESSKKKWIVVTDPEGSPRAVINSDNFLRDALFGEDFFNPYRYCHRPIVIKSNQTTLANSIIHLKVHPERSNEGVIDEDIIIFWGDPKRVITGADILGKLLKGII